MLNKKKTDMETEGVAGAASPWNTIPFLIWIKRNMAAMVALVFLCIVLSTATETFLLLLRYLLRLLYEESVIF